MEGSRPRIGSWLLGLWAGGIVVRGLWLVSPWLAWCAIVVAAMIGLAFYAQTRRRRLRGYWVSYCAPGQLDAGLDDFAIEYCEGQNIQFFYGVLRKRPQRDLLFVPSSEDWDRLVSPWVRGRREEVVGRLMADRVAARCEIAAASGSGPSVAAPSHS
jgi:hypothetical protein